MRVLCSNSDERSEEVFGLPRCFDVELRSRLIAPIQPVEVNEPMARVDPSDLDGSIGFGIGDVDRDGDGVDVVEGPLTVR